ncbi:hypothetical protein V2J09_018290 [Rumex salicifolius]
MNHIFRSVGRKFVNCFSKLLSAHLGPLLLSTWTTLSPPRASVPTNQKQLRSFLGLANYYRGWLKWSIAVDEAFQALKFSLTSSPVLALPCFDKPFVIETNASNLGIGVVLMQDHHPIRFISRALGPKDQSLFVYEKELLAVVHAMQSWSAYLTH